MNLGNALEAFYAHSKSASEGVRTLALAGVGIVWIFREPTTTRVPGELVLPLALFAAALAFDLFQYVAGAAIWGIYHRYRETRGEVSGKQEFLAPVALNWPINACFAVKIAAAVTGYVLLIAFLWKRM